MFAQSCVYCVKQSKYNIMNKIYPYYPSISALTRALAKSGYSTGNLATIRRLVNNEKPRVLDLDTYVVDPKTGELVAVGEWEWVETPGKFLNQEKQENGI